MYNEVTEAFQKKILEPSRTFRARLVNVADREDVIDNGFFAISYNTQSNEDTDTLSLGSTVSAQIEVDVCNPTGVITGKEYEYQIGIILDDDTIEYVTIGLFTAQKPIEDGEKISFTAYDRFVSKLGYLYVSDIAYPANGKKVLYEIQEKSGVEIKDIDSLPDDLVIPQKAVVSDDEYGNTTTSYQRPFDGFSYREAIGYIAFMYGKFATINRRGEVELRWYKDTGYRVERNMSYNDISCAETYYEVQYIECSVGDDRENVLTVGNGTTGISGNAPVMTQGILSNIYDKVGGMKYIPTTLSFKGDPRVELGDIITVVKCDGTEVKVPVMSLNFDYDGGLSCKVGSYGDTEESATSGSIGPTTQRLDRVYSELLLVRDVVATKVSVRYLQANFATIEKLSAVEAKIDKINATEVTVSYLEANYADINLANVDIASIRQGFLTDLMVSQGLIADRIVGTEVTATDVLTGVNIYADDITAGTLSVDRLVFRGDEKSIVYQLNSISGALQAASVDTLNGEIITPRSITADRIVAQSITANEINVTDLVATGLIGTNQLTAANIATDAITSTKIAAGAVTATKISVADLYALGATIGGFDIGTTAIYNGTDSKISTKKGIYLGTDAIRMCSDDSIYTHIENGRITTKDMLLIDGLYGTYYTGIQTIGGPLKVESTIMTFSAGVNSNHIKITNFSETEGVFLEENTFLGLYFPETDFWTQCVFNGLYFEVGGYAKFKDQVYFSTYVQINGGALIANASIGGFLEVGGNTYLSHTSVGGYNNASYALSTNSFICNSWVRTVGNSGWYNETYGGGWYMTDSTYIRNYNGKHLFLSGNCYFSNGTYLVNSSGDAKFRYLGLGGSSASSSYALNTSGNIYCGGVVTDGMIRPNVNSTSTSTGYYLGQSSYKWRTVYAYNSTINTSDRNEKHNINYGFCEAIRNIYYDLKPVSYVMNSGERTHFGIIAQDAEETINKYGYTIDDLAFLCRDHKCIIDGDTTTYLYNEDGTPQYIYGVRYTELIALTLWQTQEHETRLTELEQIVSALEMENEILKKQIEQLKAVA